MQPSNNGHGPTPPAGSVDQHKEAFALMWYACKCGHRERVWNGRDGVTPYTIGCPSCGGDLGHSDWRLDIRAANHTPHVGQLVFGNGTPDEAVQIVTARFRQRQPSPLDATVMLENVRQTALGNIKDGAAGFWHEFAPGWPHAHRHKLAS